MVAPTKCCLTVFFKTPCARVQDPQEGFLATDGSLTVRLRVRLLFLVLHVYKTSDLAAHRGFGVVPVRGKDRPEQYHNYRGVSAPLGGRLDYFDSVRRSEADEEEAGGMEGVGQEKWPGAVKESVSKVPTTDGPLCCSTFEVLQCTSLEELEKMVARAFGVSPADIRLWVITQPVTDAPLAPRELLRCNLLS